MTIARYLCPSKTFFFFWTEEEPKRDAGPPAGLLSRVRTKKEKARSPSLLRFFILFISQLLQVRKLVIGCILAEQFGERPFLFM